MSDGGMLDGGGLLILGSVVATGVGALCVTLAVLFGIEPNIVSASVLALAVGVTITLFSNADNFVVSGMVASAITLITLLVVRSLVVSEHRGDVINKICSDESCIRAMAETAMWRAAMAVDPEEGSGGQEFGVPGGELLAPNPKIPDAILRQAARQWAALPESHKETLRKTRKKLMERSHGERLNQYGKEPKWATLIPVGCLSLSVAFFAGASAAIRGGR